MKKLFLLLILAVATVLPAKAQDAGESQIAVTLSFPFELTYGDMYDSRWDLYSGYEPGYRNIVCGPSLGVEYGKFITRRIRLGAALSWYNATEDSYIPAGDVILGKHYRNNFYLKAQVRYCYLHTRKWQLYSGAGVGGSLTLGTMKGERPTLKPGLTGELIAFGAQFGPKVPFFFENVFSHDAMIWRFGLAYKF